LLKAETAEQEVRSVASQLKARFPVYRAPAGFDLSSSAANPFIRASNPGA
jgi:hypothetical protein